MKRPRFTDGPVGEDPVARPGNSPPLKERCELEGGSVKPEFGMSMEDMKRGYAKRSMPGATSASPDSEYFRDDKG